MPTTTLKPTSKKAAAILAGYRNDPLGFVGAVWPDIRLAPYQAEILRSVCDNPETWVRSANEMGKSFVAALTAIWWFSTRKAKVITSSATERQLENVLWGELDSLLRKAAVPLGLRKTHLRLELPPARADDPSEKQFYCQGYVPNAVAAFQGHHLPRLKDGTGTVLFIFEEASELAKEFYDAATSQAHSLLVIGNPLTSDGIFFEKCSGGDVRHPDGSGRLFRRTIRVSGEDSPNVILGRAGRPQPLPGILTWETFQERKANWTPYEIRTRLLGEFPDEATAKLFPPQALDLSQAIGRALATYNWQVGPKRSNGKWRRGSPFGMGVDVSWGGGDKTVWCVVGRYGVRHIEAAETPDTSIIVGRTIKLMERFGIEGECVAFDAGGGGRQIADRLREDGYDVVDVNFGEAPTKAEGDGESQPRKEYLNMRAELYGELAKAVAITDELHILAATSPHDWPKGAECFSMPAECAELRQDLGCLPLWHGKEGRLKLPPKDVEGGTRNGERVKTVRQMLGGRSPDHGDACVLGYYAYSIAREWRAASRVNRPLIYGTDGGPDPARHWGGGRD